MLIEGINSSIFWHSIASSESVKDQILSSLLKKLQIDYEYDSSFELKNNNSNWLRWDFIIGKKFIEYNGIQHYEPVEYWGGEEKFKQQQEHDLLKEEFCKKNNYPFLVIKYDETNLKHLIYNFLLFGKWL